MSESVCVQRVKLKSGAAYIIGQFLSRETFLYIINNITKLILRAERLNTRTHTHTHYNSNKKAVRLYQKTESREIAVLLEKAEKYV